MWNDTNFAPDILKYINPQTFIKPQKKQHKSSIFQQQQGEENVCYNSKNPMGEANLTRARATQWN